MSKSLGCLLNFALMICALTIFRQDSITALFVLSVIMCLINIAFNVIDYEKQIVFIAFNALFLLFLMSRDLVSLMVDGKLMLNFSDEINHNIIICLIISLTFLSLGSYITSRFTFVLGNRRISLGKNTNIFSIEQIKIVSRFLMYLSAIPALMIYLEQIAYVNVSSYYDFYLTYASRLPGIIVKIGDMYLISFFAFLACLPTKKECKWPLFLYTFLGVLSLGTGQRNQMMLHLIVVFIYLFYRQSISDNDEVWMPRRRVVLLCFCIPFAIVFLYYWGNQRIGEGISGMTFGDILKSFFIGQGKSIDIIGYAMRENIPSGKLYSFGDITDFFINSFVSKNILGTKTYRQYTVEYALNMHSFGQLITYLVAPTKYLAGGGIGSSFIAEAYVDFGYVGIAVWSYVYGVILTKLSSLKKMSWVKLTFLLFAISKILMAPRSSASSFIAATFSIINIGTVVIILFLSKTVKIEKS